MITPKFFPDGVSVRKHTGAAGRATGKWVGTGSTTRWRGAGGGCRNGQEEFWDHDSDLMSVRRKGREQNC